MGVDTSQDGAKKNTKTGKQSWVNSCALEG